MVTVTLICLKEFRIHLCLTSTAREHYHEHHQIVVLTPIVKLKLMPNYMRARKLSQHSPRTDRSDTKQRDHEPFRDVLHSQYSVRVIWRKEQRKKIVKYVRPTPTKLHQPVHATLPARAMSSHPGNACSLCSARTVDN